jgi:hypothetical protein
MKKVNFKELLGEVYLNKIANELLKMSDEQILEHVSTLSEETKNRLVDILEVKLPKPKVKVPAIDAPDVKAPEAKVELDPQARREAQVADMIKNSGATPSSRSAEIDSMNKLRDMEISNTRGQSQGGPTAAELKAAKDGDLQTQRMDAKETPSTLSKVATGLGLAGLAGYAGLTGFGREKLNAPAQVSGDSGMPAVDPMGNPSPGSETDVSGTPFKPEEPKPADPPKFQGGADKAAEAQPSK